MLAGGDQDPRKGGGGWGGRGWGPGEGTVSGRTDLIAASMNRQLELYTSAKDAHFGCKCVPKRMTGPFRTGLKYSEYTGLKIQRVHWQRQIRALCLREAVAPFCKSRHWTYCRHLFKLLTPIFRARSSCSPTSAFRAIFSIYLYLYIYITDTPVPTSPLLVVLVTLV